MKLKDFLIKHKWILLIGVFFFIIILALYIFKFGHYSLSDSSNDWGNFGDYFGGVLAPIFSFISVVLILYSINEQRTAINKQKFETQFFNLLELHKNTIHNLEVKRKELYLYETDYDKYSDTVKSYAILNELMDNEEKKMTEYFNVQTLKNNRAESPFIYNYRALNNHFIQTRDYLSSIISDTLQIFSIIKESEISPKEKALYTRLLKDKLTDAEKFFLVISYIQINNSIKNLISRNEIRELAGPKEWILRFISLNDNFPFCIPGICIGDSFDLSEPLNHYLVSISDFLEKNFFYLIKIINSKIKCERIKIYLNGDLDTMFQFALSSVEFKNRIFHYNLKYYFEKYLCKNEKLESMQPIRFKNYLSPFYDKSGSFNLRIAIEMNLNNEKYLLNDNIYFQFQQDKILINSSKNITWKENWRIWSFKDYSPV